MSRQARQTYLEKFTVERMVEGYGRIYQDIIKKEACEVELYSNFLYLCCA